MSPNLPQRKSIRLKNYDYSQTGLYFITICIQNKKHLLGTITNNQMILNDAGKMVSIQWFDLLQRFKYIQLHEYVVMPNHFHGIIYIDKCRGESCIRPHDKNFNNIMHTMDSSEHNSGEHNSGEHNSGEHNSGYGTLDDTVGRIVQAFKSITTHEYIHGVKQNHWQPFNKKLWQRNYWEHIIRNKNEYYRISEYIKSNPLKWNDDKLNYGKGNVVMEIQSSYNSKIWMV